MPNIILSHGSALSLLSDPQFKIASSYVDAKACNSILGASKSKIPCRQLATYLLDPFFSGMPTPIDILVSNRSSRNTTKLARYHCMQAQLPAGSFLVPSRQVAIADTSVFVSSPALCLAQSSLLLDDIDLAMIALELCGGYALVEGKMIARPAVTNCESLSRFFSHAYGMTGAKRMRRLLPFLSDGSRSPRESHLFLLASLSRGRGGFGITKPEFNYPVPIPRAIRPRAGFKVITPDLFWPEAKIAIEYDSSSYHFNAPSHEQDSQRRNLYQLLGIEAYSVTPRQFADFNFMLRIFGLIGRRVNPSFHALTSKQQEKVKSLHWRFVHNQVKHPLLLH